MAVVAMGTASATTAVGSGGIAVGVAAQPAMIPPASRAVVPRTSRSLVEWWVLKIVDMGWFPFLLKAFSKQCLL